MYSQKKLFYIECNRCSEWYDTVKKCIGLKDYDEICNINI